MMDFDVVTLLIPVLETIEDKDQKLLVLVAIENGTKDKEVFKAINELRWDILREEESIDVNKVFEDFKATLPVLPPLPKLGELP